MRLAKIFALSITFVITTLSSVLAVASTDYCKNINGTWKGSGYADFTFGKCSYSGEGTITRLDNEGNISFDMQLHKVSGSGVDTICYSALPIEGSGFCKDNQLEFRLNGVRYNSKLDQNMSIMVEDHTKVMKTIPTYIKATLEKK
ncbi:MAG: hypothetical protein ACX932_01270 [Gammaproteobacteria bacterium]